MEKINQTILLTNQVFNILLNNILSHFKKTHKIDNNYKDSQLYGFGNFNTQMPSLKNDFEAIIKGYVNGKYLYNKYREATSGKPIIKISRDYKFLVFNYLGYKNIAEFIESDFFTTKEKEAQLKLLNKSGTIEKYYYVCYYYGEDNQMNKGQVIIYNDWKNIEMVYIYVGENETKGVYTFYGTISQSEDFVYFDTKYYLGTKKHEGAKFVFFIGKSSPNERNYLLGTYSGFDKYDRAIAGKMILKKYNTKNEIEEELNNKLFNPIICQELNKKRIIVESAIKKNPLLFSKKSPFAEVLLQSAGTYIFQFIIDKKVSELKLKIENYHYNIVSLNDSIIIEDDRISVINKGKILNLDFSISGIFYLQKVSIYIDVLNFMNHKKEENVSFIGVDINNKIVSGIVRINNLII